MNIINITYLYVGMKVHNTYYVYLYLYKNVIDVFMYKDVDIVDVV